MPRCLDVDAVSGNRERKRFAGMSGRTDQQQRKQIVISGHRWSLPLDVAETSSARPLSNVI